MSQIKVSFDPLSMQIARLKGLAAGLDGQRFITTELINESRGQTAEAINEYYHVLNGIENELAQLVMKTEAALTSAGRGFIKAENQALSKIGSIS